MTAALRFALVVAAAFVLGLAIAQPDGVSRYDVLVVPLLVGAGFYALEDAPPRFRAFAAWSTATFLTLGVVLQLWARGWEGRSVTLGGVVPWSDAGNFYGDAARLVHGARFALSQRPLASGLTAVLLRLGGNDVKVALVVTALAGAASVALVASEVWRTHGWRAAAVTFVLVYVVVRRFAGLVQTENLGLPLGALAFALLWRAADRANGGARARGAAAALVGSALLLLTLGLVARAGAFFVLPALVAWAWRSCGRGAGAAGAVGSAAGFGLHKGIIAAVGTRKLFGYFAYTLYGIVFGGDYTSALRDHPELVPLGEAERAAHIFPLVRAQIAHHPGSLVAGVGRAFLEYFASFHGVASYVWFNPDDFAIEDAAMREAATRAHGPLGVLTLWREQMGSYSLVNAAVMGALAFAAIACVPLLARGLWRARRGTHAAHGALLAWAALGTLASIPFNPPWDIDTMQVQATTAPFVAALYGVALFGRPIAAYAPTRWPKIALVGPVVALLYTAGVVAVFRWHVSPPARASATLTATGATCAGGARRPLLVHFDKSAVVSIAAPGRGTFDTARYATDLAYIAKRNAPLVRSVALAAHAGDAFALVYDATDERQAILVDDGAHVLAHFRDRRAPAWGVVCTEPLEEPFVARVSTATDVP